MGSPGFESLGDLDRFEMRDIVRFFIVSLTVSTLNHVGGE